MISATPVMPRLSRIRMIHHFSGAIPQLPLKLNSPFSARVPEVVSVAAGEVMTHVAANPELKEFFESGKMLGVMVVRRGAEVGYIAAYSGNLPNNFEDISYFVPPVYDLRAATSFFPPEEQKIVKITDDIEKILNSERYVSSVKALAYVTEKAAAELASYKVKMAEDKVRRHARRKQGLSEAEEDVLIRQSQFQKAEYKRMQGSWNDKINNARLVLQRIKDEVDNLRTLRAELSAILQNRLFGQFVFLNGNGERQSLLQIFENEKIKLPPAGAGECAAPRLLQYALKNGLTPVGIGEFWYGEPLGGDIRIHGNFYEACVAKCRPILRFMLQGIDVEAEEEPIEVSSLRVLYEDEWLLAIDKPAGLLSVPGKSENACALTVLSSMRGGVEFYPVHRLDLDTSGVLVFAKSLAMQTVIQKLFASRDVHKTYYAIVNGVPENNSGTISLPMRSDYLKRPRQVVDFEHGKIAVTDFEVVKISGSKTKLKLIPHTGRTHQLRVHCAHHQGLAMPIVGDRLYGFSDESYADRMMLHAAEVEFVHPMTCNHVKISASLPECFSI